MTEGIKLSSNSSCHINKHLFSGSSTGARGVFFSCNSRSLEASADGIKMLLDGVLRARMLMNRSKALEAIKVALNAVIKVAKAHKLANR